MNKKAADLNFWMVLLLISIIVLVISFIALGKAPVDTITDAGESATLDSDGDGMVNTLDPCPCGSPPNQVNKKIPISGYNYCLSGFDETQCTKIIDELKFKGFSLKEYRGQNVCVYQKTSEMNKACPVLS